MRNGIEFEKEAWYNLHRVAKDKIEYNVSRETYFIYATQKGMFHVKHFY